MEHKDSAKGFKDSSPELVFLGSANQYEEDIFEMINEIKLFESFSRDEISSLCHFFECYAAPRNFTLINEGDIGNHLLLMLNGDVQITKRIPSGAEILIAKVGVGCILGEMSMVDGHPRFASCSTLTPVDFAVFTRESFDHVLLQMPRLGNKFLIALFQISTTRLRLTCETLMQKGLYQNNNVLI